jgi:hypothetical protein
MTMQAGRDAYNAAYALKSHVSDINAAVEKLSEYHHQGSSALLQGFIYKTYRCASCPTEVEIRVTPRSLFTGPVSKYMAQKRHVLSTTRSVDFAPVWILKIRSGGR